MEKSSIRKTENHAMVNAIAMIVLCNQPIRMRTFELNPDQIRYYKDLSSLPTKNLFYVVVQQKIKGKNFTLPELKKYIKSAVKQYELRNNINNIKYIAIFENTKEFHMSQHNINIVKTHIYAGFHFHLFISGVAPDFIDYLNYQFNRLKHKRGCISAIDGKMIEHFDEDFKTYHLKQMMFSYSPQLVLSRTK
jgi:hypothetical protein